MYYANSPLLDRLQEFPKIVMAVSYYDTFGGEEVDICHVRLFQPVSSATAFTILETPYRQDPSPLGPNGHSQCFATANMLRVLHITDPDESSRLKSDIPIDCLSMANRNHVRPLSNLRKLTLHRDAYLHDRPPARLSAIETDLRLHNLEVEVSGKGVKNINLVATYIEWMKAAAMQRGPKHLFDAERKLMPELMDDSVDYPGGKCMLQLKYTAWHLNIALNLSMATMFVQKVS
jgi:hypothetical protein